MKQILPAFQSVRIIHKDESYEEIYRAEQTSKNAWLLNESELLWEFVEELAEADDNSDFETPLNLHNFYIAYNLKFPNGVILFNKSKDLAEPKDLAELLTMIIRVGKGNFSVQVPSLAIKVKLLQQFVFLRIFLLVTVNNEIQSQTTGDIGIFGTKKSGKSALINALLGDEYVVSSPILPTPNKMTFCAAKDKKIFLIYRNAARKFATAAELKNFLTEKLYAANKNSATLDEMTITLPKYPTFLNGARLIDTPGSNFAVATGHADITERTLSQVTHVIFVMNYSQYLTNDELELFDKIYKHFNNDKTHRPILIALNRIDEMFASRDSKSYERAEDYIHYRLKAMGYENFFVISISALQAVYFKTVVRLIEREPDNFFKRFKNFFVKMFAKPVPLKEQLDKLKSERAIDKVPVVFVEEILKKYKYFHGVKIDNIGDLQKINRIHYLICLLDNLTSGSI